MGYGNHTRNFISRPSCGWKVKISSRLWAAFSGGHRKLAKGAVCAEAACVGRWSLVECHRTPRDALASLHRLRFGRGHERHLVFRARRREALARLLHGAAPAALAVLLEADARLHRRLPPSVSSSGPGVGAGAGVWSHFFVGLAGPFATSRPPRRPAASRR